MVTWRDRRGRLIVGLPLHIPRAGIRKGTAGAGFLPISRHPRAARASQPPTPIASSWSGRLGSKGVAADKQKLRGRSKWRGAAQGVAGRRVDMSEVASVPRRTVGSWEASALTKPGQASATERCFESLTMRRPRSAASRPSVRPSCSSRASRSIRVAVHTSILQSRACSWGSGWTLGWTVAPTGVRLHESELAGLSRFKSSPPSAATRSVR